MGLIHGFIQLLHKDLCCQVAAAHNEFGKYYQNTSKAHDQVLRRIIMPPRMLPMVLKEHALGP